MYVLNTYLLLVRSWVRAQVISVDFSKDGDWIRSNCEGGQLYIWDSNKGKHQVTKLGGWLVKIGGSAAWNVRSLAPGGICNCVFLSLFQSTKVYLAGFRWGLILSTREKASPSVKMSLAYRYWVNARFLPA